MQFPRLDTLDIAINCRDRSWEGVLFPGAFLSHAMHLGGLPQLRCLTVRAKAFRYGRDEIRLLHPHFGHHGLRSLTLKMDTFLVKMIIKNATTVIFVYIKIIIQWHWLLIYCFKLGTINSTPQNLELSSVFTAIASCKFLETTTRCPGNL
jgi:hypothetical protein